MNQKIKKILLGSSLKTARELLKDPKKLNVKIQETSAKLNKKSIKKTLGNYWEDLKLLLRLIKSSVSGDYKDLSKQTLLYAVVAIIYFLAPIDLIPDIIAGGGYIDDIMILKWVFTAIAGDLEKFRQWEIQQSTDSLVGTEEIVETVEAIENNDEDKR